MRSIRYVIKNKKHFFIIYMTVKNQRGGDPNSNGKLLLSPLNYGEPITKPEQYVTKYGQKTLDPLPPRKSTLQFPNFQRQQKIDDGSKRLQNLTLAELVAEHQQKKLTPLTFEHKSPPMKGGKPSKSSSPSSTHIKTSRTCKCNDGISRTIYIRVKDNRECVKQKNQSGKMTYVLVSKVHEKKHKK